MIAGTLKVRLTLQGPILVHGLGAGDFGMDAVMLRNADDQPIIPGTLVLGKVRDAWEGLGREEADKWLGRKTDGTDPGARKLLVATDFGTDAQERSHATRTRIAIDAARGAVEEGALLVTEAAFATGEAVVFEGEFRFLAASEEEAGQLANALTLALNWLDQLGADGAVGYGRVLGAEIIDRDFRPVARPGAKAAEDDVPFQDLKLCFDQPVCFSDRPNVGNLFVSTNVISGGAIKGTIAAAWAALLGKAGQQVSDGFDPDRPVLSRHFSVLRVLHGFPVDNKAAWHARPSPIPWSYAKVGDRVVDVALLGRPHVFASDKGFVSPQFPGDWKSRKNEKGEDVRTLLGWPTLRREVRVRTKINATLNRAEAEQLFAYEMVCPGEYAWRARIGLHEVPDADRGRLVAELRSLVEAGLIGFGKTKARARATLTPAPQGRHWLDDGQSRRTVIMRLRTPALLANPADLMGKTEPADTAAAYAKVFAAASGGTLSLRHLFARQKLSGQAWQAKKAYYYPFLLTEEGSVFVFDIEPGDWDAAAKVLITWRDQGLPLPDWVWARHGARGAERSESAAWTFCPHTRFNGYGEVDLLDGIKPDHDPSALSPVAVSLVTEVRHGA